MKRIINLMAVAALLLLYSTKISAQYTWLFNSSEELAPDGTKKHTAIADTNEGSYGNLAADSERTSSSTDASTSHFPMPTFIEVPGGTFTMGCKSQERDGDCEENEKPFHEVTVSSFFMSMYEVTVEQYLVFVKDTGDNYPEWLQPVESDDDKKAINADSYYKFSDPNRDAKDLPIVGISWNDANIYAEWLSQKTGQIHRLPTEAEWEYAARGGKASLKDHFMYSGSNDVDAVAWYKGYDIFECFPDERVGDTNIVGQKEPNQLGLYDMSGNAWEFRSDWYGAYSNEIQVDPKGPSYGSYRVVRGGAHHLNDSTSCRVAHRFSVSPLDRYDGHGFRLVRE